MNKPWKKLRGRCRPLRTHPGGMLFGPTGARLWCDYLDSAPGFQGRIDFIHKQNLPLIFTVRREGKPALLRPMMSEWSPEEGLCTYEDADVFFTERKLLTWEDTALSLQTWENRADKPLVLCLTLPDGAALGEPYCFGEGPHGVKPVMCVCAGNAWPDGRVTVAPGERATLWLCAAFGLAGEENGLAELAGALARASKPETVLSEKREAYDEWFQSAPCFACSDELMTRAWWYRFYILRKNLADPRLGALRHPVFYEGRSHRMEKTPGQAKGWEFSRLIPLSTPLTMLDAAYLHGQNEVVRGGFRSLVDAADAEGAFVVTAVDERTKEYAHFAAWALYRYALLTGDMELVCEVLEAFKRDAKTVYNRHKSKNDDLQVCYTHALTGKEYQPGFWYFAEGGWPDKVRPAGAGYTPLKRVDSSVYMYLNCLGLSRLCEAVGDTDEAFFARRAEAIGKQIVEKMWDEETGCFYDLHAETDEMAMVKHIVAFDPFWAGLTGKEHLPALELLTSPELFARGSGFASVAADCPVYSASGGWKGDYFKGRDGCMWNGPSWPYTQAIALDALGEQSIGQGHRYDVAFREQLEQYTLQHFRFGDVEEPYLVEHYNCETGEMLSDEPDYNHSYYVDLIARYVAGVHPTEQGIRFEPLNMGLSWLKLEGLYVRGHRVDVTWQARKGLLPEDMPVGWRVMVDGELRWQSGNNTAADIPLNK